VWIEWGGMEVCVCVWHCVVLNLLTVCGSVCVCCVCGERRDEFEKFELAGFECRVPLSGRAKAEASSSFGRVGNLLAILLLLFLSYRNKYIILTASVFSAGHDDDETPRQL